MDDGSRIIYRQLSVTLFCRLTKIRLQNIGRMFGANHHSTVIHAKHMMGLDPRCYGPSEADWVPR